MTEAITLGQLRAECRFRLLSVLECGIHSVYREHIRAEVRAVVKGEEAEAVLTDTAKDGIVISAVKEDGSGGMIKKILFAGTITAAEIMEEGGCAVLTLCAASHTWKMDLEEKSRSFQDMSLTYRKVAEGIVQEYGGKLVWDIPDRRLEHPLIQYRETDYTFLCRILSHMGYGLTAGNSAAGVYLRAVAGESGEYMETAEADLKKYEYTVALFRGRKADRLQEGRQRGYRIEDGGFLHVGDAVRIRGKLFHVMEAHAVSDGSALRCVCLVFPEKCFMTERIPAETLRGTVLEGKVLETSGEMVKLHLDIDAVQPVSGAYEFPWKPVTGNMMYCMPEAGTKAALYVPGAGEPGAAVIYSIRENGERCGETADYHDRYLTTDGGRRMYLKPSEMGIVNMQGQNAEVSLKDGTELGMKTVNRMSVLAEGQIQMKGRTVTLSAPKETTLVRKDLLAPTVINMCNAFDAIGKTGNFAAEPQVAEKKRRKSLPSQAVEEYPMDGLAEAVLSGIPAGDFGGGVMEAVAGSMPVISRTGIRK